MLQPLQLKEVSLRFADEIAELRDFLAKAGLVVGTAEILGGMAARLASDRAFHRDLTSYIWIVIDRRDRQISYPDLLGVLAIAAAGPRFAAAADERDAHDLLRFLMEARRSLDTIPQERTPAVTRTAESAAIPAAAPLPAAGPVLLKANPAPAPVFDAPLQPKPTEFRSLEVPNENRSGRRRAAWIAAIACLLLALSVGLWLYNRPAADTTASVAPVPAPIEEGTVPPPVRVAPGTYDAPASVRNEAGTTGLRKPHTTAKRLTPHMSHEVPNDMPTAPLRPEPIPSPPALAAHAPAPAALVADVPPSPTVPAPVIRQASPSKTAVSAIPSATLSKRLDSPTLSADATSPEDDRVVENRKYPHLLRRHTPGALAEDEPTLVAKVQPADVPAVSGNSHAAAPTGIVRPATLGIMAGNILYSPSPVYPAAATAAHVQGAVTLQAEVDRNGNVASARVVSGPPLLRDAALDAVQRWRYRPFMAGGKPSATTATAVMDFQLTN